MAQLDVYLIFDGTCAEAMRFYERARRQAHADDARRVSAGGADAARQRQSNHALAAGGQVTMPLQKTFWAEAFGMLVDRFGTPWMVNCEQPGA